MVPDDAASERGYGVPEKLHRHAAENLGQVCSRRTPPWGADALRFGRVTYELMKARENSDSLQPEVIAGQMPDSKSSHSLPAVAGHMSLVPSLGVMPRASSSAAAVGVGRS